MNKAIKDIYTSFKPYMQKIIVKRDSVNKYKEKVQDNFVTEVEGYYSLGKNLINIEYNEQGSLNRNYNEMLSVMIDNNSLKIIQDDYFTLNNIKYRIVNIQNVLGYYLDFTLERV